jgi:hypothetical protein
MTRPFSVIINHTWGLRGASRGGVNVRSIEFVAIVPVIRQIPYVVTPCYGNRSASSFLSIGEDL